MNNDIRDQRPEKEQRSYLTVSDLTTKQQEMLESYETELANLNKARSRRQDWTSVLIVISLSLLAMSWFLDVTDSSPFTYLILPVLIAVLDGVARRPVRLWCERVYEKKHEDILSRHPGMRELLEDKRFALPASNQNYLSQ